MAVVHCKKAKYDIYIGRPSILGNPFPIGNKYTRTQSLVAYEAYARHRMTIDPDFKARVKASYGQILGCWCAPLPCHGDIIEKLSKELHDDDEKTNC